MKQLGFRIKGSSRLRSQKGALLPIVAVVALPLVILLFSLGYDALLTKYAAHFLKIETDNICQSIVSQEGTTIHRRSAGAFHWRLEHAVLGLKSKLPRHGIKAANLTYRLIMPTMPSAGATTFYTCDCDVGSSAPADLLCCAGNFEPSTGGLTDSTGPLIAVRPDLSSAQLAPSDRGSLIGCEVSATLSTIYSYFGGTTQTITAHSFFSKPVRGPSTSALNNPGLIIGIAPQLQTSMVAGSETAVSGNAAFDTYIPFATDATALDFRYFRDFQQPNVLPSSGWEIRGFDGFWSITAGAPEIHIRNELMRSCINPLTMVRNTFLAAVVELSSRHGMLREGTSIQIINPRHVWQDVPNYNMADFPNGPTEIVQFGDDLTDPGYELPYLHFHSASLTAESAQPPQTTFPYILSGAATLDNSASNVSDYEVNAVLCSQPTFPPPASVVGFPAVAAPTIVRPAWQSYLSRVVSSLRMCFHLYDGASGNLNYVGVPFRVAPGVGNNPWAFMLNTNFEPAALYPDSPDAAGPYDATFMVGAIQSANALDNRPSTSDTVNRLVRAADLMRMLGSVQTCAYGAETVGRMPTPQSPTRVCLNEPGPVLEPDYLGFLLANQTVVRATYPEGGCGRMWKIRAPGAHRIKLTLNEPFETSALDYSGGGNAPLLIVTNSGVNSAQVPVIRTVVQQAYTVAGAQRPITVVYIGSGGVGNLETAFLATSADRTGGSPHMVIAIPPEVFGSGSYTNTWAHMLNQDPVKSIVRRAFNVFNIRILRNAIRL